MLHVLRAQKWDLQKCIDTAIKNNLSVLQAYDNVQLSGIALTQARWNQLPTVNASASQNFNFGRSLDQSTYQFNNRTAATNNFSINSGVVLYNGGYLKNSILQNQLNSEASKYDLQKVKDDISLLVINDFISILYASEAVKNAQAQKESTDELTRQTKLFVEADKKAESDVSQLKAQSSSEQYNVSVAQGQLRTAKLALQQLMEVAYNDAFDIVAPVLPEQPVQIIPGAIDVYATALQLQPAIKSSELQVQVQQLGMKLVRSGLLPKLSLNTGLSSNYSTVSKITSVESQTALETIGYLKDNMNQEVVNYVQHNSYTTQNYTFPSQLKDNFNQFISLNLSIPIFNGKQVRHNIEKQESAIHEAQLNDKIAKNTLRKNIEQATVDAANAQMLYISAKDALDAEEISYQNIQLLFDASKATAIDLLIEKNKYAVIASQLLQAKYDLVLKLKVLDYYQGKPLYFR